MAKRHKPSNANFILLVLLPKRIVYFKKFATDVKIYRLGFVYIKAKAKVKATPLPDQFIVNSI